MAGGTGDTQFASAQDARVAPPGPAETQNLNTPTGQAVPDQYLASRLSQALRNYDRNAAIAPVPFADTYLNAQRASNEQLSQPQLGRESGLDQTGFSQIDFNRLGYDDTSDHLNLGALPQGFDQGAGLAGNQNGSDFDASQFAPTQLIPNNTTIPSLVTPTATAIEQLCEHPACNKLHDAHHLWVHEDPAMDDIPLMPNNAVRGPKHAGKPKGDTVSVLKASKPEVNSRDVDTSKTDGEPVHVRGKMDNHHETIPPGTFRLSDVRIKELMNGDITSYIRTTTSAYDNPTGEFPDDTHLVKENKEYWVKKFLVALESAPREQPFARNGETVTNDLFLKHHTTSQNGATERLLSLAQGEEYRFGRVLDLVNKVVGAHENNQLKVPENDSVEDMDKMRCSKRMVQILMAVQASPQIRIDVMNGDIEELVCAAWLCIGRKSANAFTNGKKAIKAQNLGDNVLPTTPAVEKVPRKRNAKRASDEKTLPHYDMYPNQDPDIRSRFGDEQITRATKELLRAQGCATRADPGRVIGAPEDDEFASLRSLLAGSSTVNNATDGQGGNAPSTKRKRDNDEGDGAQRQQKSQRLTPSQSVQSTITTSSPLAKIQGAKKQDARGEKRKRNADTEEVGGTRKQPRLAQYGQPTFPLSGPTAASQVHGYLNNSLYNADGAVYGRPANGMAHGRTANAMAHAQHANRTAYGYNASRMAYGQPQQNGQANAYGPSTYGLPQQDGQATAYESSACGQPQQCGQATATGQSVYPMPNAFQNANGPYHRHPGAPDAPDADEAATSWPY